MSVAIRDLIPSSSSHIILHHNVMYLYIVYITYFDKDTNCVQCDRNITNNIIIIKHVQRLQINVIPMSVLAFIIRDMQ